jgi:SAM-dependent methyltransferase
MGRHRTDVAPDRWADSDAYEAYIGRWSRPVAARFIDWLAIPPRARWVDIGCGTGALSGTILAHADPRSVIGVDPSADFIEAARERQPDVRARFVIGSAATLPIDDDSAEVVVSGLVLNFIPDLALAMREMVRVGASGAIIAAYVWDYAGRMELLRRLFDAAVALDPAAVAHDEGVRFPICSPDPLRRVFDAAGLVDVVVEAIEVPMVLRDFDDYWTPFLSGVGPAPGYVAALEEDQRVALRERLRATLPMRPDGSIHLVTRAWAVRGGCP